MPSTAAAAPAQLTFTAKTVDGQDFTGETLAGKPAVGVAALDELPAMQEFVTKYDVGFFTNIADVDGSAWQNGDWSVPWSQWVHWVAP